jgi:hypothetical protein
MRYDMSRLELGPGNGVVAAVDGISLLVSGDGSPEQLIELAREAVGAGSPPGRGFARRLAALLTGDEADHVPAFGALADAGEGTIVFLHGAVTASTTTPDGEELRLSGAEASTWVDRILPPGTGSVLVALAGTAGGGATPFELESGVVPGGWLRLVAAPAPTPPSAGPSPSMTEPVPAAPAEPAAAAAPPTPPPAPPPPAAGPEEEAAVAPAAPVAAPPPMPPPPAAEQETGPTPTISRTSADEAPPREAEPTAAPAEFESFSLVADRTGLRAPLPVEAAPKADGGQPAVEEAGPAVEEVRGILCSRQHFNSPDARYCSICGISMVHQTHDLIRRPRPPLGFLVFDDGSTFTLQGSYVLGREPDTDELVSRDEARPIVLDDPGMTVSRVHAEIRLVEWDVQLIDRGSTNGTHVWDATNGVWERLVPEHPRTVRPGDRGAVGQRIFVYETPHRQ